MGEGWNFQQSYLFGPLSVVSISGQGHGRTKKPTAAGSSNKEQRTDVGSWKYRAFQSGVAQRSCDTFNLV